MSDHRSALADVERGQADAAGSRLRRAFNAVSSPLRRQVPTSEEFHTAVDEGNLEKIESLIADGAPIDGQDVTGKTPLMSAAGSGNAAVVKLLLKNNADSELRDDNGNTVIHRILMKSDITMLKTLVEGKADLETRNRAGQTALEHAIMMLTVPGKYWEDKFDILLNGGANAKAVADDGITTAMWAAMANSEYALKALKEKGADLNAVTKSGTSALTVAANNDSLKAAALLLDGGITTSNIDENGKTPRQNAEEKGFQGMVSLIVSTEAKRIVILLTEDRGADTSAPQKAKFKKRGGSGGGGSGPR